MKKRNLRKPSTGTDDESMEWTDADFAEATYHPGAKIAPKRAVSLRVDADVLAFFKSLGRGYQTRMNHVLASYVRAGEQRRRKGKSRDV